jgi:hypothetical protein
MKPSGRGSPDLKADLCISYGYQEAEFYYSGKPTPQVAWNTQKSLGYQPKLNVIKLIKIILLAINGHILCVKHHASSPAKNNNCSIKSYLKTKPRIKN